MASAALLKHISSYMNKQVPFQQYLGLEITRFDPHQSEVRFRWKEDLMGNVPMQILHGGVTASALDTAGGCVILAGVIEKMGTEQSFEEVVERMSRCGTIDLRVDYVRPGRGEEFICTAHIIRSGNKVAVARMELHNSEGMLIAFGTGTYIVG